ncbi:hypothetical protein Pyn_26303 [Prunus yedoensis var. nudiflora]|uniref:Uncharacterized protein n=1 Tax=Prunus yedoensis var. nudiflora TaxID=2094558 RepID=A0A314ZR73_PRUYE|nr:hypothetical protein Pyn_26303 [Prunus yedoensis var. nudiflora]
MSQISSSSTSQSPSARKLCRCGGYIKTWTSWTDLNPGRRFEACEMSRKQRKWASLGMAGRNDLCKRKRTNSWVAEKNESNGRGPKVNRRTEERSGR